MSMMNSPARAKVFRPKEIFGKSESRHPEVGAYEA
jgi:hypothetical protein